MLTGLKSKGLADRYDFKYCGGFKNFSDKFFPDDTRQWTSADDDIKIKMCDEALRVVDTTKEKLTIRKIAKLHTAHKISFSRFHLYKYFGNWNNFLKCCGKRLNRDKLTKYSNEELKDIFIKHYGVDDIPVYDRLKDDYDKGIFMFYGGLLKSRFGSYSKFLSYCGVSPRSQSWFNNHKLAKDGDMCNSYSELVVDNFFYDNGIGHDKEVYYKSLGIKVKHKYRTDWVLKDGLVVEFCGMMKTKEYAEKMEDKRRLLKQSKIPYIFLEHKDLDNLAKIFRKYIKKESMA